MGLLSALLVAGVAWPLWLGHGCGSMDEAACPAPSVTNLTAHALGKGGRRVEVRMRAQVARGYIGSLHVTFGDRSALIADLVGRREISTAARHTYKRPGTYRFSVVAESTTPGCRRYRKSPPAMLRLRVPLRPTSYPSSL
jgi:hypothetical protein